MTSPLPRPDIIRHLVERYYQPDQHDASASSHWKVYGARASVVLGEDGTPTVLHGEGFGDARWNSLAHRVSDNASILAHVWQSSDRQGLRSAMSNLRRAGERMGADLTFDAFRQAATFALIARQWPAAQGAPRVLIIGDGHGLLGAPFRESCAGARITQVDLGRTLLFQSTNCQRAFPQAAHALVGLDDAHADADFRYCPAEHLSRLAHDQFGIAVNVASMQEMTPQSVGGYFAFLRRHMAASNLFYCCNRESKQLPGGERSVFADYPWSREDKVLVDGPCPWHQYFLSIRPPFVRHYDGRHVHRLVVLHQESA